MKGEAAWETYAKMLCTLLSDLEAALENPTALVQAAVVRQGKGLLRRAGFDRRLASLKKHTKTLEETTLAKLKELKDAAPKHSASLDGFGAALDQKVRRTLHIEALKSVSRFISPMGDWSLPAPQCVASLRKSESEVPQREGSASPTEGEEATPAPPPKKESYVSGFA